MPVLTDLSNALAAAAEKGSEGLVRVEARRRIPATGVVWSTDGLIVTNHHVIHQTGSIRIGLPGGETVPGLLVGRDSTTDLAVLRVENASLMPPAWIDGGGLRVGHLVLALGRPGRLPRATLGVVSALGEQWRTPTGGALDRYLQTDVSLYPGFTGGPLVDVEGAVLGVNSSALLRGVSLTIPTPTVRQVVEALVSHGRIRRGYLGVGSHPVQLPASVRAELEQDAGLILVSVEPESAADRGGLLIGDVLVGLNGQPVESPEALFGLLNAELVGAEVPIRLIRGGEIRELRLTVGERP